MQRIIDNPNCLSFIPPRLSFSVQCNCAVIFQTGSNNEGRKCRHNKKEDILKNVINKLSWARPSSACVEFSAPFFPSEKESNLENSCTKMLTSVNKILFIDKKIFSNENKILLKRTKFSQKRIELSSKRTNSLWREQNYLLREQNVLLKKWNYLLQNKYSCLFWRNKL